MSVWWDEGKGAQHRTWRNPSASGTDSRYCDVGQETCAWLVITCENQISDSSELERNLINLLLATCMKLLFFLKEMS